jgi:DNA-binding response OmpR family regulator
VTQTPPTGTDHLDVLLIDDGQIMAELTAEILRTAGFLVAIAPNLDAALQVIESRHVGTVILDHHLRGENGERFFVRGRKLPPVIVVSGMGQEVLKAYEAIYGDRVFACLAKPVPPLELINTVIGALADS